MSDNHQAENSGGISLAVIAERLAHVAADVTEIKNHVDSKMVTQAEFQPVKLLVYGLVSLILVSVVGGLLTLVLHGSGG